MPPSLAPFHPQVVHFVIGNVFVGVAALELIALALSGGAARTVRAVSALAGIAGVGVLYETAEHGGDLVYSYAGGVGIRTGNPEDVGRLLVAGLYNESQVARKAGKGDEANLLIKMLVERNPTDTTTRLMWAESQLLDRKDPEAALTALDSISVRPDDARM